MRRRRAIPAALRKFTAAVGGGDIAPAARRTLNHLFLQHRAMRIIVWGINYQPEVTGIAPFNRGLCRFLAAQGHQTSMVSAFAYYPAWRKAHGDRARVYRTDLVDGIPVHRCWNYVPARPTTRRRILHELSFGLTSFWRVLRLPRADLYIVISPPLLLGPLAALACWLKRSRYVFHVQDLQPDAAIGLGLIGNRGFLTKALHATAAHAYRHAALVSGISAAMLAAFAEKGIAVEKRYLFPNWVEGLDPLGGHGPRGGAIPNSIVPRAAPEFAAEVKAERMAGPLPGSSQNGNSDGALPMPRHGAAKAQIRRWRELYGCPPDAFLASYSGNLGKKQGLEVLIDAADALAGDKRPGPPAVHIVIAGDGAMREALEQRLVRQRVRNLRLLPLLPDSDYRLMLAASDVCVITQARGTGRFFLPSKLLTILAAGRPVVAAADETSELALAVRDGGFGAVVPPEDPRALAQVLSGLAAEPAKLAEFGQRGRAWVTRFNAVAVLGQFEGRLREIAGGRLTAGSQADTQRQLGGRLPQALET